LSGFYHDPLCIFVADIPRSMIKYILTLLLALLCSQAIAQYLKVTGVVTDSATAEVLPNAQVTLANKSIGTTTDPQGKFIFHVPQQFAGDTLLITYLGYRELAVPLRNIDNGVVNRFKMCWRLVPLKEVTLTAQPISAEGMVKAAVGKIASNYNYENVVLQGFFRDWKVVDHRTDELDQSLLVEAAVNIHFSPTKKKKMPDIYLKAIRRNELPEKGWNYFNSLQDLLSRDYVKSPYRKDFYDLEPLLGFPNHYHYVFKEEQSNARFTCIEASTQDNNMIYTLLIDEESGAIKQVGLRNKKQFTRGSFNILFVDMLYQYRQYKGKWFLSYCKRNWRIQKTDQEKLVSRTEEYYLELLINDIKQDIPQTDVSTLGTPMIANKPLEFQSAESSDSFWQHYNVIENDSLAQKIKSYRLQQPQKPDIRGSYYLQGDTTRKVMIYEFKGHLVLEEENRKMSRALLVAKSDTAYVFKTAKLKDLTPSATLQVKQDASGKITQLMIRQGETYVWVPTGAAAQGIGTVSGQRNGFTRADTLRGKSTAMRSCYDVTFYDLDVTVDMNKKYLSGSNVIRFRVKTPFDKMQIDLYANMKINKILYEGRDLHFRREYNAVFVDMPQKLSAGEYFITVYYEGTPQEPDFDIPMKGGFLWGKDDLGNPWVQVVCQGSGASLWWPNKDHLSDEPDSMRIAVTVPAGYTEISNGRLITKKETVDRQWRYEWLVSYPINNYNATINIGKYEHRRDYYITRDTLTIDYYSMPYHRQHADKIFAQTKSMLSVFEKHFGKYPFPRDGFTLVESLYPMEHQSGVCLGRITQDNFEQATRLMWHEVAHEWWGNNVSCTDMAELWIHEAFATYGELLMIENTQGNDAVLDFLQDQQRQVKNLDPIVGAYDVNHIFYDISDMYSKGVLMLYTLRQLVHDDVKWNTLLMDIQKEFQYSHLTNKALIEFVNKRLGKDYIYLFNQYLYTTNLPVFMARLEQRGKDLQVAYRWRADVADFRLPVRITTAKNTFSFIYPTCLEQVMTIRNLTVDQFKVDRGNFYYNLEIQ
jgi:hypothetical protein